MQIIFSFIFLLTIAASAIAQGKGVDQQNSRIRDASTDRAPAINGTKQDVGTGRGIDFGRGRTASLAQIPNPYRFTTQPDALLKAIEELMSERKLILDAAVSKPEQGVFISQPFVFSKGAVVTESDLNRYVDSLTISATRGWTRGRYTITITAQAIDNVNSDVSVAARLEGRTEGAVGPEWVTLRSNGTAEQEILAALVEKITGETPAGVIQQR